MNTKHEKITDEVLQELYLTDLGELDLYHGRTSPKVKYVNNWKRIVPAFRAGITERRKIDLGAVGCPKVWVWSDQHFGHSNIIKYCNRPFPNVGMMNGCLEGNYLNVVGPDDVCIFVGDFGFMKEPDLNEILDRLPGYKILIYGNHDINRDGLVKQLQFDEAHICMIIDVDEVDFETQLLFTHYPMTNVPRFCINVHGHVHDKLAGTQNINVCVEHTNYAPKNLKDVAREACKRVALMEGFVYA